MEALLGLEKFSGEGTVVFVDWLRQFEDLVELKDGIDPKGKLARLKYYLTGMARDMIEELTPAQQTDYDQVKAALRERFNGDPARFSAKAGLANCRQGRNESVAEFAARISRIVKTALHGSPADVIGERLRDEFLERMHRSLAFYVRAKNPKTFQEALDEARSFEQLLTLKEPTADPHALTLQADLAAPATGLPQLISAIEKLTARVEEIEQAYEGTPRSPPVCYNCGQPGHIQRYCFQRPEWEDYEPQANELVDHEIGEWRQDEAWQTPEERIRQLERENMTLQLRNQELVHRIYPKVAQYDERTA